MTSHVICLNLGATMSHAMSLRPLTLTSRPLGARGLLFFSLIVCSLALHPRNAFKGSYDMARLVKACPSLAPHVVPAQSSKGGRDTINFADASAVRAMNKAILASDYGIQGWDLPEGKLCPPIPGRADYIHHMADVLAYSAGSNTVPRGASVCGVDIGTGASLIYPLIGAVSYSWSFIASECDSESVASAERILASNRNVDVLSGIEIRYQDTPERILAGILPEEADFVMCNPPFYESSDAFHTASQRKRDKLELNMRKRNSKGTSTPTYGFDGSNNFGGKGGELWCPGGEMSFVKSLAKESQRVGNRCLWFSSLISQASNLPQIRGFVDRIAGVKLTRLIEMGQGSKKSNILLWTYMDKDAHREWGRRRSWVL